MLETNPAQGDAILGRAQSQNTSHTLRDCLQLRLAEYLDQIKDETPGDLYDLVMAEVEQPLFESLLAHTRGNLSRAAEILGIHRATLRRKLDRYNLL